MNTKNIKKLPTILLAILTALCIGFLFAGIFVASASEDKKTQVFVHVDTLSYESDYLPNGVVGKSYPLFDFYAVDGDGKSVADAEVLVCSPNGNFIPTSNSRFDTALEGRYTIIYKATKGTIETKVELFVDVISAAKYTAPSADFEKEFVLDYNTGNKVFMPKLNVLNGLGNIDVERTISYSGDYECDEVVVYDYGQGAFFVPIVSGEYAVNYTLCDIVGTTTNILKTVSVTDSDLPFLNTPSMPLAAVVGETLKFNRAEAFVYIDGKKIYVPVKTFVNDIDVTENMTFSPSEVGSLKVKYQAVNVFTASENNLATYEAVITVSDAEENKSAQKPYINNFLHLDNFDGAYIEEPENAADKIKGVEYDVYTLTTKGEKDTAFVQFKSDIPNQYAFMKIGFNTVNAFFDQVYLYYTDSISADKVVEICLKKVESYKTDVWVNGTFCRSVEHTFSNQNAAIKDSIFCFEIDSNGVLIESASNTEITTISSYKNGDKYDFFPSGNTYLSIALSGIEQKSDLKIYEIAEQSISGQIRDRSKPIFVITEQYSNVFNVAINQPFSIVPLTAFDLFDDDVNVEVSVVGPDNKVIYSGILSNNDGFTPTQYGRYTIYYRASDSSNNSNEKKSVVNVLDRIAPIISIVSLPSKVKVGSVIEFKEAQVTDNFNENLTTWIYVTDDNFKRLTLDETGKFKFSKAGTYFVKYGAEDETGNYTVITYKVVCE